MLLLVEVISFYEKCRISAVTEGRYRIVNLQPEGVNLSLFSVLTNLVPRSPTVRQKGDLSFSHLQRDLGTRLCLDFYYLHCLICRLAFQFPHELLQNYDLPPLLKDDRQNEVLVEHLPKEWILICDESRPGESKGWIKTAKLWCAVSRSFRFPRF